MHKPNCHDVQGLDTHCVFQTHISNAYLLRHLKLYACLAFDLTYKLRVDIPHMVHVELGIKLADIL